MKRLTPFLALLLLAIFVGSPVFADRIYTKTTYVKSKHKGRYRTIRVNKANVIGIEVVGVRKMVRISRFNTYYRNGEVESFKRLKGLLKKGRSRRDWVDNRYVTQIHLKLWSIPFKKDGKIKVIVRYRR